MTVVLFAVALTLFGAHVLGASALIWTTLRIARLGGFAHHPALAGVVWRVGAIPFWVAPLVGLLRLAWRGDLDPVLHALASTLRGMLDAIDGPPPAPPWTEGCGDG